MMAPNRARAGTLELETVFGGVAGEVGDRIAGNEQDEEEIEDSGQHLAPGGNRLWLRDDSLRHVCAFPFWAMTNTATLRLVRFFPLQVDGELDRLPLPFGGNEGEVVVEATRLSIKIAAQEQPTALVDRRFAGGDRRHCGNESPVRLLVDYGFEPIFQLIRGELLTKRLRKLVVQHRVIAG